ncbi:hypothetical protein FQZ97_1081360 [compost metagenome]
MSTTSTTAVRNASLEDAIPAALGWLLRALLPGSMEATLSSCSGWPFSSKLSRASKIGIR